MEEVDLLLEADQLLPQYLPWPGAPVQDLSLQIKALRMLSHFLLRLIIRDIAII